MRCDIGSPPHARGRLRRHPFTFGRRGITPACAGKTVEHGFDFGLDQDHPRMRGEDLEVNVDFRSTFGSPPHARGRLKVILALAIMRRITPACAGKTLEVISDDVPAPDHPRMRGEDSAATRGGGNAFGSPPHARGRHSLAGRTGIGIGITPACAGKTKALHRAGSGLRDHPRMRGEDDRPKGLLGRQQGSPPHARGRQLDSPGNPTKPTISLPVFLHSQPSPLKRFLLWVLGL